ncbi:MAG: 50S ribosomal protein L15 [Candidatus Dojkabacteria bacterium]|nr:MAG: 50S ribosomal protein L15 [Candidatus Dojkabacteria bacterium]
MINNLPSPKTTKKAKQVGRGYGSGKGGHTTGRGTKGQKARSGYKKPIPGFEGGQNPLSRRLPKLRGLGGAGKNVNVNFFKSRLRKVEIKLSDIAQKVKDGDVVDFDKLKELGFTKIYSHKRGNVKILFDKDIDKKISFKGLKVSKKVKEVVEKAGGKVE